MTLSKAMVLSLQDYAVDILNISRHMLTFLSGMTPLPTAGERITQSFFAFIWNLPHRLGSEKDGKLAIETALQLQHSSLMFLCLLPNLDMLTERIQYIMLEVLSVNKEPTDGNIIENCNKLSIQIFSDILKHLKSRNSKDTVFLCLKVFFMFVEHLIKVGSTDMVGAVFNDFNSSDIVSDTSTNVKQIVEIAFQLYKLAIEVKALMSKGESFKAGKDEKSLKKSQSDHAKRHKSKEDVFKYDNRSISKFNKLTDDKGRNMAKLLGSLTQNEVGLLHSSFYFVCSLLGTKTSELSHFPPEIIKVLVSCVHNATEISKTLLMNIEGLKKKTANVQCAVKKEDISKIYQTLLMAYFKKLLLVYQVMQNSEGMFPHRS